MIEAIYVLCALTSAACAVLLYRGWRRSRTGLLFWSALSFIGLTLNNGILVIDRLVVPETDLGVLRSLSGCVAVAILAVGLAWEEK
jgi:hypothetical protein